MQIHNGADGPMYPWKIDNHHRGHVLSNHVSHEQHHATYHKDLFYIPFTTTLPDTSKTPVAFIKNTESGTDLELFDILVSGTANMRVTGNFRAERSSGGAAVTPVNSNVGTPIILGADAYEGGASGDLTLDTSNVENIGAMNIAGYQPTVWQAKGGIVLPNQKSFHIDATGTGGETVDITLVCAVHPAGTKL